MNPELAARAKGFCLWVSVVFTTLIWIGLFALLFAPLEGCTTFAKAQRKYATNVVDTTFTVVKTVLQKDSVVLHELTDTTTVYREIHQGRATIIYRRNPKQTTVQANCDSAVIEKKVPVYVTKQVWGVNPNYKTATHILIGLVVALILVYLFTQKYQITPKANGTAAQSN